MEDNETLSSFLTNFKLAAKHMIATSEQSYKNEYGQRQSREKTRDYSEEEILNIINSGSIHEQKKLSRNYFYKDGFYKRILIHYATLLKYVGILIPRPSTGQNLSNSNLQKRYNNALDFLDRSDLQNVLTNCATRALIDGTYFGVIQTKDKNHVAVLDLPANYCYSRFKDINGNDLIEFDLSYFNSIPYEKAKKKALESYPKVITRAYQAWRNGFRKEKFFLIPPEIGICFPFFDGRPLFLNVIPATIQYDKTVAIERERALDEIRKIIVQTIPHNNDGSLLFEPEEAQEMHSAAVGMLAGNRNISVLTSYADVEAITSRTSTDTSHTSFDNMLQNIYHEAGASSQLFGSTGSTTLASSLQNDTAMMMYMANKFSRFLTNTINSLFANSNITFRYDILPVSYYNEEKYIENTFKLASNGYSWLLPSIAVGINQRDLGVIKDLENNVLKLKDKMIPLSSSYTQSAAEAGAPAKDQDEKQEATIKKEISLDGGSK